MPSSNTLWLALAFLLGAMMASVIKTMAYVAVPLAFLVFGLLAYRKHRRTRRHERS